MVSSRQRVDQLIAVLRGSRSLKEASDKLRLSTNTIRGLMLRNGLKASDYMQMPEHVARSSKRMYTPEDTRAVSEEIPVDWADDESATIVEPVAVADERKPEAKSVVPSSDDDVINRLVALARKKEMTIEAACDGLDVSPKRLRQLVESARGKGYLVDFAGQLIGIRPNEPSLDTKSITLSSTGPTQRFAVASDIHAGSKWFLKDQFVDFIHRAYNKGVRNIFLPGDNLDGCYRHSRWEETHHGFHDQAKYFLETLPRLDGLKYDGIIGNHDETFESESGLSVVHSMNDMARAMGRDDFTLHGARGAYLRLVAEGERRGVFIELWHPRTGGSYALTYHLQKHVEKYAPGSKADFCFAGHWHTSVYCTIRGVHCFASGTFHGGGGSYSKSLGGSQSIGAWIIEYATTDGGTIREVKPEWVSYFEREEVRDVELG